MIYFYGFMMWFVYLFCRPYWRCYYSNTDAIIYVVDSMDRDRIGISKQELVSMLEVRDISFNICIFAVHGLKKTYYKCIMQIQEVNLFVLYPRLANFYLFSLP